MIKDPSYKIYLLRYDCNSETECFMSVTIHGNIPNEEHSYHGKDFDYKYISGDISIYNRSVETSKRVVYNGYCTATQKFFFEDLYDTTRSEPAFFYNDRETWKNSSKMKKVYEVKCRDIYFKKGTSLKKKYEIMREMLDQKISTCKLYDEISKLV